MWYRFVGSVKKYWDFVEEIYSKKLVAGNFWDFWLAQNGYPGCHGCHEWSLFIITEDVCCVLPQLDTGELSCCFCEVYYIISFMKLVFICKHCQALRHQKLVVYIFITLKVTYSNIFFFFLIRYFRSIHKDALLLLWKNTYPKWDSIYWRWHGFSNRITSSKRRGDVCCSCRKHNWPSLLYHCHRSCLISPFLHVPLFQSFLSLRHCLLLVLLLFLHSSNADFSFSWHAKFSSLINYLYI